MKAYVKIVFLITIIFRTKSGLISEIFGGCCGTRLKD